MTLWPLIVHAALVTLLVVFMVGASALLGERHREHATSEPFESGMKTTGDARVRFGVNFYLVAVFFVIFDLEAAFLFAWAVTARSLGWPAFVEITLFVLVLLAALFYLWRCRGLDWGRRDPPALVEHDPRFADRSKAS